MHRFLRARGPTRPARRDDQGVFAAYQERRRRGLPLAHEGVTPRYVQSYPERFIVQGTAQDTCHVCKHKFSIWWTKNSLWARLPPRLRDKRICVSCFREHASHN